ncbi:MAG: VCBS repeat-containing protein, partial [Saprospiraceae bacterium]|nr:VCBS repeat-containing protein [Saprospiraceae bacterium]
MNTETALLNKSFIPSSYNATLATFFLLLWAFTPLSAQSPEICDNGLDDDADGLLDCYDTADCPCASTHDCHLETTRFQKEMDIFWKATGVFNAVMPSIVGDLDPWNDGIPEIVTLSSFSVFGYFLFKGDGSNRNNPDFLDLGASLYEFHTPVAMADLDANGVPELFMVCADKRIRVYTQYTPGTSPPMQLWAISTDTCESSKHAAYSADFNGDGISEIYVGNEVFGFDLSNPMAPVLRRLAVGVGPVGSITGRFNSSIAAELLEPADCNGDPDCDGLEIAAGFGIYSVDIDPTDGDGMQIKLQRNLLNSSGQNFSDGFTAFADLNNDGINEVIVSSSRGQQIGVYVWNKTGFWRFFELFTVNSPFLDRPGMCVVGNVFDDRSQGFSEDWPEILLRHGQ